MSKRLMRPVTVGECKRFLSRYGPDVPLRLLRLDTLEGGSVDLPFSVGQIVEAMKERGEDDPVMLASPGQILGVWGVLGTLPPTLVGGRTTQSLELN